MRASHRGHPNAIAGIDTPQPISWIGHLSALYDGYVAAPEHTQNPENNVQGGEPAYPFFLDWVVGVRDEILHWVLGV